MQPILKTIERIAVLVGVGFTFFAVLETIRAWETLSAVHPWLGYAFLLLVALLLFYLVWQLRSLLGFRAALTPPVRPGGEITNNHDVKQMVRYLDRVTTRFVNNPYLKGPASEKELTRLRQMVVDLRKSTPTPSAASELLRQVENESIAPMLKRLDERAEALVSDNVGLVTLGTALSPYRSIDLYIVLARNFRMVNQILQVYRTRPTMRETLRVFYDIARTVAAVNLLNAMDNVWAGIGRHMPKVGTFAEAVSEGMFSGLLTSVAGHAAIDRSRSYQPWSGEEAVRRYRGRLNRWARDVLGILIRHGFDKIVPGRGKKNSDETFEDLDSLDASGGKKSWLRRSSRKKKQD